MPITAPTIPQLAAALGISEPTLRRRVRDGSIEGLRRSLTGRYTLPPDAAQQIIARYTQPMSLDAVTAAPNI